MSSLAASRADNYYYPPDFDGEKHKSINTYNKSHPLGARAKHLKEKDGWLVVRFEMPFNAWCGGCGALLARGIRFNARKRRTGSYHSTPIYTFTMLTTCCCTELEIVADPKLCDYVIVRGARKDKRAAASDGGGHGVDVEDEAHGGGRDDPMKKLELRQQLATRGKSSEASASAPSANPILDMERKQDHLTAASMEDRRLEGIWRLNQGTKQDDYTATKALRRVMRSQRNQHEADALRAKELCLPEHLQLRPSTAEDRRAAAAAMMDQSEANRHKKSSSALLRNTRRTLGSESIFKESRGGSRRGASRQLEKAHPVTVLSEKLRMGRARAGRSSSSPLCATVHSGKKRKKKT